ncbi:MAG: hypothetical protein ACXADW_20060 [Candidatus Hodarchaeales archaeon]|jgi:hypothetical protein
MKLGIGLPLTTDREYSQFWDSFNLIEKPDYVYLRPMIPGAIDKIRNELIREAKKSGCSHVLLMDTDQTYPSNTVMKLLSHRYEAPVIGTVVYRRYKPFDPLVFKMGEKGLLKVEDEKIFSGELIDADAIGCGCVFYNMQVFEEIEEPWFKDMSDVFEGKTGEPGAGEDINFCYKLKTAGFELKVDTSITIDHLTLFAVNKAFYILYSKLLKLKEYRKKGE